MSITMTTEQIAVDRIQFNRETKTDEPTVKLLMISIANLGVLQPIIVKRPSPGMGVHLIFGRHRLEACKRLKLRAIPARVINGDTEEIRCWCACAEMDENLARKAA